MRHSRLQTELTFELQRLRHAQHPPAERGDVDAHALRQRTGLPANRRGGVAQPVLENGRARSASPPARRARRLDSIAPQTRDPAEHVVAPRFEDGAGPVVAFKKSLSGSFSMTRRAGYLSSKRWTTMSPGPI
jgi:hypothetical protein